MLSITVQRSDLSHALVMLDKCKHIYIQSNCDQSTLFLCGNYTENLTLRVIIPFKFELPMAVTDASLWVNVQEMKSAIAAANDPSIALDFQNSNLVRSLVCQNTEIFEPRSLRDKQAQQLGNSLVREGIWDGVSPRSSFRIKNADFLHLCKVFYATTRPPYLVLQNVLLVLDEGCLTAHATNGVVYTQNKAAISSVVLSAATTAKMCLIQREFCNPLRALNAPSISFFVTPSAIVAAASKSSVGVNVVQRTDRLNATDYPDTTLICNYVAQTAVSSSRQVYTNELLNALKYQYEQHTLIEFVEGGGVQLTPIHTLPSTTEISQCVVKTKTLRALLTALSAKQIRVELRRDTRLVCLCFTALSSSQANYAVLAALKPSAYTNDASRNGVDMP